MVLTLDGHDVAGTSLAPIRGAGLSNRFLEDYYHVIVVERIHDQASTPPSHYEESPELPEGVVSVGKLGSDLDWSSRWSRNTAGAAPPSDLCSLNAKMPVPRVP